MASLCHPSFTTTKLSYRFPIFETSATALCGTTGRQCFFFSLVRVVGDCQILPAMLFLNHLFSPNAPHLQIRAVASSGWCAIGSSGKLCQSMPEPRVPRKRTVDCQNWTCDRACRKAGLWPLVIWFIDGFPSCFQAERSLHVLHVDCVWPLHVFIHVVLSWRIWHSIKKFQCRHWRLCGFAVSHVHRICSACCCWHETQEVLQGHTRHLSRNISGQLWRQTALCNVLCFHHLWVEPDFAIFCQCV